MNAAMDFSKTHVVHQWKHERPLIACRISPDGQQVVSSSEDSTLQLWKIPSGEKLALAGHESWVHALCYSPDSQRLVSGGCDGKLIWWDAKSSTAMPVRTLDAHTGWIRALAISPDGQLLASVGNDRTVRLWSMSTGEKVSEWPAHERHIYSILFHPNGSQIVTGDLLGVIHVWNVAERKLERSFDGKPLYSENKGQNAEYGGIRSLAFHAQRNELIAGGTHKASNPFGAVHEPLVLRFAWDDGSLKKTHACEGIPGGLVWRTQWLSDGTAIAVSGGSTGGILLFFADAQEKEVHRFMLPSLARDMDVHADSNMVATAHYDTHLRVSIMNA
jgi:WD40 repeat protein